MLEKLRSRHPIDVPAEAWGRSRGLLGALGTLALLFLVLPILGLVGYGGYKVWREAAWNWPLAIGLAMGALVLVLLVGGARGKPGHARR